MIEEEIIEKESSNYYFRWLFYIGSFFVALNLLFEWRNWAYSLHFLVVAGIFYEIFSILRLIYHPKKSMFQTYSYLFFILLIPGFLLNQFSLPAARFFLYPAVAIPVIFFIHQELVRYFIKR